MQEQKALYKISNNQGIDTRDKSSKYFRESKNKKVKNKEKAKDLYQGSATSPLYNITAVI